MLQQIDRPRGARERRARILITVLIFLIAAAFGLLGGEWGQVSAQTVPTMPPTATSTATTQASTRVPSATPTATFVIVPSPTATQPQTATAAEPTETAVPLDPTSHTPASTPTEKSDALLASDVTVTPQPEDQDRLEAEQWWQSPWALAIGLVLLLTITSLIRRRKGVQDQTKGH